MDDYFQVVYDIDDSETKGHVSKRLTVEYGDGTTIKIGFDEIGDEPTARVSLTEPFFVVGRGGRVFPRVLNRGTAPNLWAAKRAGLLIRDEFNRDFFLIMNMSMVAISFVMPPPTAGLPWRFRFSQPPERPKSHFIYEAIDAKLNRLRQRMGRPFVPEEVESPVGQSRPVPAQAKTPYAILPNGEQIPPDHFGEIYYGTSEFAPEQIVRVSGIPPKTGARDRHLFEHTADGANSDFRGGTPFIRAPDPAAGQGAAEFAVHGADEGWVYRVEGAPVWELGQHLEGRVPDPVYGYRSARPGTRGEVESVFESQVAIKHITDVWRVTRVEGKIRIEKLDWARIKATTKTSDIPASL